jgi:hypothetical protein
MAGDLRDGSHEYHTHRGLSFSDLVKPAGVRP